MQHIYHFGAYREAVRKSQYRNGMFRQTFGSEVTQQERMYHRGAYRENVDDSTAKSRASLSCPVPRTRPLLPLPAHRAGEMEPLLSRFFGLSNAPIGTLGPNL